MSFFSVQIAPMILLDRKVVKNRMIAAYFDHFFSLCQARDAAPHFVLVSLFIYRSEVGEVIFFGPGCSYGPTSPKRSSKPHDRSLFRSLFLAVAGPMHHQRIRKLSAELPSGRRNIDT